MIKRPLTRAQVRRIADRAESRALRPGAKRKRAGRPRTNPIRVVIALLPAHIERLDRYCAAHERSRQSVIRMLVETLP
jgi:hypothetical protein